MNWRRYILNFIGVLVFAVLTIITIIIARGNRIDLQSGRLVETGTIRLTTKPEEVKAFINETAKTIREKRIEALDPGVYKLRLAQDGFTAWEGSVEVKAGFITDIAVTLFPTNQKLEKITQTNIDKLFSDRSKSSVVYSVTQSPKGSDLGIWRQGLQSDLLNPSNSNARKISNFNTLTDFVVRGEYRILLSPNGDKLLLCDNNYDQIYLLDTTRYNEPNSSNQIKLGYPVDSIYFLDANTLIIRSGNLLSAYSLDSQQTTLLYYHPTVAPIYSYTNNAIYWLSHNRQDIFFRSNNATTKVNLENIRLPAEIAAILVSDNEEKILLQASNNLYFIETSSSYIKEFVNFKVLSLSPNGQFILGLNSDKVNVIETTDSEVFNEITHSISETKLNIKDLEQSQIEWAIDSSFFSYYEQDGDLIASDSKGVNFTALVSNEANRGQKRTSLLAANGERLLTVLQDGVNETVRYNIYQLEL